ncbi:hypothetical protein [Gordoniibacillus kamchatkensis]|nr:hypothetical protein [Paenibacillus sp. VKM B-2647]
MAKGYKEKMQEIIRRLEDMRERTGDAEQAAYYSGQIEGLRRAIEIVRGK